MRKVFWCCAATAVAWAGVAYLSADYACRHPFSLLGRSIVLAYNVGMSGGEIFRVTSDVITRARQAVADDPSKPYEEHSLSCVPPDPMPVHEQNAAPCPATPKEDVIDTTQGRLPGKIVINEEQEPPAAIIAAAPIVPPADVDPFVVPPISAPLVQGMIDDDHRTMPYCSDDDPPPPEIMPPCMDDNETKEHGSCWTDFWSWFFPMADAETTTTGGNEDSEMIKDYYGVSSGHARVPALQEDPSIDTQYPGCPHSDCHERVVCPYTGKSYPVDNVMPTPEKPKQKKKKQKPEPKHSSNTTQDYRWWWGPIHPELDTMEFRPTDWKQDDVQLPPF
jgi:hypothetical protein